MKPIYLDFNASTPIAEAVVEAMTPLLHGPFGNPSSPHWAGQPARDALERARSQVAGLLGCQPDEIVFTSGGSEANNLALKGAFFARRARGDHVVTTAIEHPSVAEPLGFLRRVGANVTVVPVDGAGLVDPDAIRRALTPRTILISVMHANNEVGTVQPIEPIARIARARDIWFHTDAAQTVGKLNTRVDDLGVDLLTIAGHKVYAPKGVGALYVRRGVALESLVHGAGHEGGRRAGTESALLAVGLGTACELAADLSPMEQVRALRDELWTQLQARFGARLVRNGASDHGLPNTLNVSFLGEVGAALLSRIEGVALATGSACHAGRAEPSPVLRAMGVPPEVALGAVRFSLGRTTTRAEIAEVVERIAAALGSAVATRRAV